jgi:hypothetical protein
MEASNSAKTARRVIKLPPNTPSVADLIQRVLPEQRWAVDGIIPEGVTIFAGKPKTGKSWAALATCIAVATGGKALGKVPVIEGDALYLALEDNERRLQDRLRKLLAGAQAPTRLFYQTTWRRSHEDGIDHLEGWILAHPKTRLVCIDTLAKFRRPSRGKNAYEEDYEAIGVLKKLADAHGVPIVVLHHDRKAEAADVFDGISGTLGLSGAADGLLMLKRERGAHDAVLHVTGRDVEEREIALRWDAGRGLWSIMGDAQAFRMSPERRAIIQALEWAGGPLTSKAIADAVGKTNESGRASVRVTLKKMVQAGQVRGNDSGYMPFTPFTDQ